MINAKVNKGHVEVNAEGTTFDLLQELALLNKAIFSELNTGGEPIEKIKTGYLLTLLDVL